MSQGGGAYPAETCPNKSPPDVVAVMTQSLMTQQPASPQDVYSIAMMTTSSSKVLTGQISHDKIYYGQMIKLQPATSYRKEYSKTVRLNARPKFPGFERGSVSCSSNK
jgi:hypothetical protein